MNKLLSVLSVIAAVLALNTPNFAFADQALPEIAPVDEAAPPSLEATTAPDPATEMPK